MLIARRCGPNPRLEPSPASAVPAKIAFLQSEDQTRWFAVLRAASGPPAVHLSTARAKKRLVPESQTESVGKLGKFAPLPLAAQPAGWLVRRVAVDSRP